MEKIDLKKKKAEEEAKRENSGFLGMPIYLEGVGEVKQAIIELTALIDNHEDYDFDQIKAELAELAKKSDLEPLFKSLEGAINKNQQDNSESVKSIVTKQIEGFSTLQRAFYDLKPPVVNVKAGDLLAEYRGSDQDINEATSYFGFIHPTGKWYIVRQSGGDSGNMRYFSGTKDYRKGWSSRQKHSYKYYDEIRL